MSDSQFTTDEWTTDEIVAGCRRLADLHGGGVARRAADRILLLEELLVRCDSSSSLKERAEIAREANR